MKLISILLMMIFSANVMALDITCEGPNLHYINQFDLETSVDFDQEDQVLLSEEGLKLEGVELTAYVTNAGFEESESKLELKNLDLTVKIIDKPILGKAFYLLRFTSKKDVEEKVFVNMTVGYPGLLTSYIRLGNLKMYKSTCK